MTLSRLILNVLIISAEQVISFLFLYRRYKKKSSITFGIITLIISILFRLSVSFLEISTFNLIAFFGVNLCVLFLCFKIKAVPVFFNAIILSDLKLTSVFFVRYLISILKGKINLTTVKDGTILTLTQTSIIVIFLLLSFATSAVIGRKPKKNRHVSVEILFAVLPVLSVSIFTGLRFILLNDETESAAYSALMLFSILSLASDKTSLFISFMSLVSNTAILIIYERTIREISLNSELIAEKNKEIANAEYYSELEKQYETSNILVHDIKNHLYTIGQLSSETEVKNYIDSILNNKDLIPMREFSKNKLVNAIISRYAYLSSERGIEYYADIRHIDFTRIDPIALTTVLDNLLRNAVEAASKCNKKTIEIKISLFNENFVKIEVVNTCINNPLEGNNNLESTKSDSEKHGFGLKSVRRVIDKYDGVLRFLYRNEDNTFSVQAIIPLPVNEKE